MIKGVMAFSILALLGGGLAAAQAATNASAGVRSGFFRGRFAANLTPAQKAEREAQISAREKTMEARRAAVQAALGNNDYQAWLTAIGSSSPLAAKITASNFPQYVQAYNLRRQADQIMSNLGLNHNDFGGRGLGLHLGLDSDVSVR